MQKIVVGVIIVSLFSQSNYHATTMALQDIPKLHINKNVPALDQNQRLSHAPAQDSATLLSNPLLKSNEPEKKKPALGEDVSERTEYTKTIIEKDSKTKKQISLADPLHYKKDGKWEKLGSVVKKDERQKSIDLSVGDLKMTAKPLSKGIDYAFKGKNFSVSVSEASDTAPKLTKENNTDVILYENVFPNVDIKYHVSGYSIKEFIVLKDKSARTTFNFEYKGVTLQDHPSIKGALSIKEIPDNYLYIAPLNVSTNKNLVTEPVIDQHRTGSNVNIKLNEEWFKSVPADKFPVVIDPTWTTLRKKPANNAMQSIRSDGYRCGFDICSPLVGNEEYPDYWASWRTLINIPFDELQSSVGSNGSMSARLHLVRNGGVTSNFYVKVAPAGCSDFNCAIEDGFTYGEVGNDSWIDVSHTIDWMFRNGMTDDPLILYSPYEAMTMRSVKSFDLSQMYLEITYLTDQVPPQPEPSYPADKKVVSTLQPSLGATTVADPDGDPVRYTFFLMSSPKDIITTVSSLSSSWTVPDGLLKDGVTYYWSVIASGPQSIGSPGQIRSFKVDLRKGKDSTQSYNTAGPISIDQATGNASTSVSSHSIKTLGGDLGVSLDYNTPASSREGLVAEYWDNTELTGNPKVTTVTPDINFNWYTHFSPSNVSPGGDNFSARYTGYLNVPQSGSYTFGIDRDDGARVYINDQLVVDAWSCCGISYGSAVTLTAGVPAKIKVEYRELTGQATLKLLAKGPSLPAEGQVVDRSWFQTGVRQNSAGAGLRADYYMSVNNEFPSSTMPLVSSEETSFNFKSPDGLKARAPGGIYTDVVRYKGYIKVPESGIYKFQALHSGGVRMRINQTQIVDNWNRNGFFSLANDITLTAGQWLPIEIEYITPVGGDARLELSVQGPGVASQILPSNWLSQKKEVLPQGWQLGLDSSSASFDHLRINTNSITLLDSTGSAHEYKWEQDTFIPPAGEHGVLSRNTDNTYSFKDDDAKVYIFNSSGDLTSMTTPTDDKKPTALKYTYAGSPSRVTRITDGINANRYATLYYAGINDAGGECDSPAGWSAAPTGYLCKVKTTDGNETRLYYEAGNLARVAGAGDSVTDYGYDIMRRVVQVRDPLANDALRTGARTQSDYTTYDVTYDELGRVDRVTYPAATAGATRLASTYKYLVGATELSQVGASQPLGYSQRVEYDDSYRTVRTLGLDGLASTVQWDAAKDIIHSSTDALGLKSTTIRDSSDRPIAKYGPAPESWFGVDNLPNSANAANVPKTETQYDEGMQGLSASFYDNKSLAREPKARTFERGDLMRQWTTANRPVTPTSDGWGVQMTGEVVLSEASLYTFKLYSDDGVRLYIDNRLYIDDWTDGDPRYHESATYDNAQTNKRVKIRIEYYDKDQNDSNSKLELRIYKPGSTEQQAIQTSQFLVPDFSLTTSESVTDSTLGKVKNTRTYNRPEYGVLDKVVLDPGYLNYTSTTTTETPGVGFFRQTSKTLPGGNKTTYQYYTSYDVKDNPCTPEVEAAPQAGMLKGKVEPDPDGTGPQTSQTSEMIYDQSGQVVAARINNEAYTCTTYDARGRVAQTVTPAHNGRTGMTNSTNYAVDGNPLKIATSDSNGSVITELDLLGRTIKYTDVYGKVTTPSYDAQGRITTKVSSIGTETFTYDNFDRLTNYAINNVVMAKPYYDSYSRIKAIDYPASNQKLVSLEYDSLLRVKAMNWKLGDGTVVRETQVKSSTGLVTSNSRTIGAETLNQSYVYDKAARLRTATVGSHTMSYGFDAPSASCGSSYNPAAHRNANRTSQVIDGVTTTYCYDFADRLISSSDANYNNPVYDDRGNITQIGSTSNPIKFKYDQANRNIRTEQKDPAGNGTVTEIKRDAGGRIIARKEIKLTNNAQSTMSNVRYGYTTDGDSPDMIMDMGGGMIQRSLSLPGGITLALNSNQTETAKQRTYSIPNFHGDTMITTDYNGNKSGVFTYDPFGNQLDAVVPPQTNAPPGTTYGYLGASTRATETGYTIPITQMGDRIYLPGLGRFMQSDPVEGGNASSYIYPADPVNGRDLDGNFAWFVPVVWFVVTAIVTAVVVHFANKIIDKVVPKPYREPAKTAVTIASFASAGGAAKSAVTKAPVYVPKAVKAIKNVFGSQPFKSTASFGQAQHKVFKETMSDPTRNVYMIHADGKKGFADAITKTDVFELKPDNPLARTRGLSQLQRYSETTGLNGQLWVYREKLGHFKCIYGC